MDKHLRRLRKEDLLVAHGGWFDEENAERVVTWLVAAENLRPVVLVGAGFSRNALDIATGKPARHDQVPLWWDVVKRLAQELGVCATRYDAPTLSEMYREAFGDAKLRESLKATTADDELVPGAAHEALASYDAVAIVTMNCLDTLLDKACRGRWRRIVDDLDLSPADGKPELIYLHGHRDRPESWVMTLNQYEDLPRRNPVLMSRVRQLLAQHPWLVVGYSLTDLDFHAVTRLVSREMRGFRPLSLVLARDVPTAPERQHWRSLGFEIANPTLLRTSGQPGSLADWLAWSFRNLGTSYEATDEAIRRYVSRGQTNTDRLARHREANRAVDVDPNRAFRDWSELLVSVLTDERKRLSQDHARAVSQANYARRNAAPRETARTEGGQRSEPDVPRLHEPLVDLPQLPGFHDLRERQVLWQLHYLLEDAEIRSELVEYLAYALRRELFQDAHPRWFMEVVTLRLARQAGWASDRLEELLCAALDLARRYEDESAVELLCAEANGIGCPVPSRDDAARPHHVELAEQAYRSFMDAKFELAAKGYAEAAKAAASAERDLEVWLYTYGHASAVRWLAQDQEGEDAKRNALDAEASALVEEVRRLERGDKVAHWLEQARSRADTLLKELVDVQLERNRRKETGNAGMRFSSAGHYAWRTYREVSYVFGPPTLQRRFLEPLVPYLSVSKLSEAMAHAPKPRIWINDRLREWRGSVDERKRRDKKLVDAFFSEKADSKTELVARLECLPSIRSVLRRGDAAQAFGWLLNCAERVGGGWQSTAHASGFVDGYWSAFCTIARWTDVAPEGVLETARNLLMCLGGAGGSVLEALYELPWFKWRLGRCSAAEGFFELLSNQVAGKRGGRGRDARDVACGIFTLRRLLDAGLDPSVVSGRRDVWEQVLAEMMSTGLDETSFGEGKRASFLLERKLSEVGLLPVLSVAELFEKWFPKEAAARQADGRREIWVVLAELAEANELCNWPPGRWRSEAQAALGEANLRFWKLNPHMAYALKRFLICSMKAFPDLRGDIERFLLSLFGCAPDDFNLLALALRKEFWSPEGWSRLMHILLAACGGSVLEPSERADDGLSPRAQLEVLDLCAKLEDPALREAPLTWSAMRALALSCATDDRISVANHAAFAVVKLAMDVVGDDDGVQFAATLRQMANEARILVRLALADTGVALSRRAKSPLVRQAAVEALEILQADDNAQVSFVLGQSAQRENDRVSDAGEGSE